MWDRPETQPYGWPSGAPDLGAKRRHPDKDVSDTQKRAKQGPRDADAMPTWYKGGVITQAKIDPGGLITSENASGFRGVSITMSGKFQAIAPGGKYIGCYNTAAKVEH